jgi:hypothetical protein
MVLAFVLVMACVDARAGDSAVDRGLRSFYQSEAPAKKECPTTAPAGGKVALQYPVYCKENSKSVTKKETEPRKSEPRSDKGAPTENGKSTPTPESKAAH